jgi:hypothetical protein
MFVAAGLVMAVAACADPAAAPVPSPSPTRTAADLGKDEWVDVIDDLNCDPINQGVEVGDRILAELRGTGVQDVIVSVDCVHFNAGWPDQVAVYDGSSSAAAPVRLGVLLDDDEHLLVRKITVAGARVTISTAGWRDSDSFCCPSILAGRTLVWNGTGFTAG